MKVEYEKGARIEKIEDSMLMEIIRRSFDKMSSDDMKDLAKTLGLKDWSSVTPQVLTGAIQAMIAAGGFASYQIAVIVANAVWKALFGAGLSFATNANITRSLYFCRPDRMDYHRPVDYCRYCWPRDKGYYSCRFPDCSAEKKS